MKKIAFAIPFLIALTLVISSYKFNGPAINYQPSTTNFSDTILFPGERHFVNMQQLTFGGDNAEAYFSFDGKWIIFQRTNLKTVLYAMKCL
jgi:TolB protein